MYIELQRLQEENIRDGGDPEEILGEIEALKQSIFLKIESEGNEQEIKGIIHSLRTGQNLIERNTDSLIIKKDRENQ